ncbi:MAG: histidine phosphatase family protein [Tetrasphaera sp.]
MSATPPPTHPHEAAGKLVLLRHGETEWSKSGQHTGRTDLPLTEHGEVLARAAGKLLTGYNFALQLASPLQRAQRTAQLAGLSPQTEEDLLEWDYGGYEGRTTKEIRAELGYAWSVFRDGVVPGQTPGETVEEVAARASRVLARVIPALADGDVALVGHGHALRILTTVFLRQEVRMAAQLLLDAGSVSVLQFEREQPAVRTWNRLPSLPTD